ncbi:MAG: ABC transporter ATP-binding protein/permease [Methanobrevibacter sp.]|jgi:ATP-binding cassette subfamily B protein|nr:ABC transporter ATP-binding protein/permease [Candidatus Methanovirga basalitermitum]
MFIQFFKLFLQDKLSFTAMLFLLTFSAIIQSFSPIVLGDGTNILWEGFKSGSVRFDSLMHVLYLLSAIYLGSYICNVLANLYSVKIVSKISYDLRLRVEEKIWKLPLKYYNQNKTGDIMSHITNDIDNINQTLTQISSTSISLILRLIIMIPFMFYVSWFLSFITLIIVPTTFIIILNIVKFSQPYFKKQWKITTKINSNVEESLNGHLLIKNYDQSGTFINKFNKENDELFKSSFIAEFVSSISYHSTTFISNLIYVIVAYIGALQVIMGNLSIGGVQAFIQYSNQFTQPLSQLTKIISIIQSGIASAENVFNLLDSEEEVFNDNLIEIKRVNGLIEFKDVNFSYTDNIKIINGMNLTVNQKETVAIVGNSGAGKTTLVNLIMRFYDIDSGSIELDGKNICKISKMSLRRRIGMVLQDPWLFKGTIEENIKYGVLGDRKISNEEFNKVVKATYVDNFVSTLVNGYQTIVSNDEELLSSGEKQLLTIARAFLTKPDILILDEATSFIDTRTEILIQKAMKKLQKNHTSLVIAHRLSTIRDANKIIMMDKGKIVEEGSHDELIALGGHYQKLYYSQWKTI